jgi:hypothetical protein
MKATQVLFWPVVCVACAGVLIIALSAMNVLRLPELFAAEETTSDSQVIEAVSRTEEVALLALAVQGIERKDTQGKLLGVTVPASDRTALLQYEFTAKVGVDGSDVTVDGNGDDGYIVTVPPFIFVGYDAPRFEDPIESNGAISWLTPEIKETEMVNEILSAEKQQEYIAAHLEDLRAQTEAFYEGIVLGVDPSARVEFRFAQ